MGRNEIRLRRHRISSGRIAQHRNYGDIMARHERDQKIRRIARIFTYFVIILIVILMFYLVRVWERKQDKPKGTTTYIEDAQGPSADSRQLTAISLGMLINYSVIKN